MTTHHASVRAQQRGIPQLILDLLLEFGAREHDARGAEIVFFDRRARKHVESYAGRLFSKLNEHLDTYAVVSDGKVVTVGPRHKRINHA